jgi:hypothetical protein
VKELISNKLRLFVNSGLRRIFEPKGTEVTGARGRYIRANALHISLQQ